MSEDAGTPTRAHRTVEPAWAPGVEGAPCLEPDSVEALSEVVRDAGAAGRGLLVVGGRTRLAWANPARGIERGVSLRGLAGIDEFEPDEGVLHVRAGTPLAEVRAAAEAEGWELPLDAPGPAATVGGVIATAATGPREQGLGRVADALLGLDVVGGDGEASRCGARVVKNVTGYDLARLYCGSFGSLAILTGAWLRLRPRPARVVALAAPAPGADPPTLESLGSAVRLGSLRALVWSEGPGEDGARLLIELGGSDVEVEHDRARLAERLAVEEVPVSAIDALRDGRRVATQDRGGAEEAVLQARVLPRALGELMTALRGAGLALEVEPGTGRVLARGAVEDPRTLHELRGRVEACGGFMTFEALPGSWWSDAAGGGSGRFDVFGEAGPTLPILRALKRRFDPRSVLNPGRFQGRL